MINVHFELWNCGNNVPQIQGNAFAIVAQQFDMRPNPTTGSISGSIYGSDQILCGNLESTQWLVTEYKASNQVGGQPQYYCLTSGMTFNPALTQPCTVIPPPPGFTQLFGNPINSQTWTQPSGTTAAFFGIFDFTHATLLGVQGGNGGGTLNISVNGTGMFQAIQTTGIGPRYVQGCGNAVGDFSDTMHRSAHARRDVATTVVS